MFDIALVGCGGMMPLPNRYLSSLLLRFEGRMVLIDCGEGTQVSAKQVGWGFKTIDCICLTHFHADHVAGLPGLLLSIGHSGRDEPLTIVGPVGVAHIVRSLCVIAPEIPFPLNFVEIPAGGMKDFKIPLTNFILGAHPAHHNCPCFAFRIDIGRLGKFDPDAARALNIPVNFWGKLQKGETLEHNGQILTPDMVMSAPRRGLSVSYCTDSRPPRGLPAFIQNSDLFVCEGHYGDEERLPKARAYKHMIFSEAAELARKGGVGELWLTHFSPAMPNPGDYLKNARKIFQNTHIGHDRKTTTLNFQED
ncbi:MAG: ribonuclease Z [Clostridiales bacterium]|jgi:ribonuclease Z|nr:ribonuclease Z [Clostridiales bacterium]